MSALPVDRRRFIQGFLIAGPTLVVAARFEHRMAAAELSILPASNASGATDGE